MGYLTFLMGTCRAWIIYFRFCKHMSCWKWKNCLFWGEEESRKPLHPETQILRILLFQRGGIQTEWSKLNGRTTAKTRQAPRLLSWKLEDMSWWVAWRFKASFPKGLYDHGSKGWVLGAVLIIQINNLIKETSSVSERHSLNQVTWRKPYQQSEKGPTQSNWHLTQLSPSNLRVSQEKW